MEDIFCSQRTAARVLQSGYFLPFLFKDVQEYVKQCDRCQRASNISSKDEMPTNYILELQLFDVWGIDFMGPFSSFASQSYILLVVDCLQMGIGNSNFK